MTRFNEAPIHESGKSSEHELKRFVQFGFNEAPIHESGKWLKALDQVFTDIGLQ